MSNKAAAARINGAKSKGPITEEGKARSAQNAMRHGLTSRRIVIAGESQEEFDAFELAYRNDFEPQGEVENELVHEVASARWRLRRLEQMEAALHEKARRKLAEELGPEADPHEIQFLSLGEVAESPAFRNLVRYQNQLRRAAEKAEKDLHERRAQREPEDERNEPSNAAFQRMLIARINAPMPRLTRQQPAMPLAANIQLANTGS